MFDQLSEKFANAFKHIQGKAKISESNIEQALQEVRMALLEADVNFKVVKELTSAIKEKALGTKVIRGVNPGEQFIKIVQDELALIMGQENIEVKWDQGGPLLILIVGLNGQGKTTFSGKLARHLKHKHKKGVLLVPADTFRPAAKKQLEVLAKTVEVDCFNSNLSQHPKEIVLAALEEAKAQHKEVVIVDTAGRLHVDDELMGQIREVREAVRFCQPEVLMVADAMTGQEAVNVAKSFHQSVELTGVVLSKMDSDARGGAALSIRHVTGVPIKYLSVGEKMEDLELFHPDRLAGRILDKGDVVSLVEKAEEVVDEKEAEKMMKRLEKGQFSVEDFVKQMNMINRLGNFSSLLKMLPGMGGAVRQMGDLGAAEGEIKRIRVMADSMTKEERKNYKMIKESRVKRIAAGSGNSEQRVRDFIAKFRQMEKMMGGLMQMAKGGGMPSLGGGGMPNLAQMGNLMKKSKPKKGKKRGPWGGGFF